MLWEAVMWAGYDWRGGCVEVGWGFRGLVVLWKVSRGIFGSGVN